VKNENYSNTVCVSSTDCYQLDSNSVGFLKYSNLTFDILFNDETIIKNLPGTSTVKFGYYALDNTMKIDTCDDYEICGMQLINGTKRAALNKITEFANLITLEDQSSPQHQALCWLLNDINENVSNAYIVQRYVLAVLFYTTNGENWNNNDYWKIDEDQCVWYGISCLDGIVTKIDLSANNLNGILPSEISELKGLEYISLESNKLFGPFPSEMGKLQKLKELNLSNNKLDGTMTSTIKHLKLLKHLILSSNQFTASVPSEIGHLDMLETLDLSQNALSGDVADVIYNLTALRILNLSNNLFRGNTMKLANINNMGKIVYLRLL